MTKIRLDVLLVERGLVESRAQAQRLVMAGQVRVEGQVALKPAASVVPEAQVEVEQAPRYVSRGGEKLQAALEGFGIDPTGMVCADVGASTGGFTDCLLQHGARGVFAIDVGQGILHWKVRQDPRVVVMERTNARYLEQLPEPVRLVTIDASFISLKVLLPVVRGWFVPSDLNSSLEPHSPVEPPSILVPPSPIPPPSFLGTRLPKGEGNRGMGEENGDAIALIKPQFEAGRKEARRGGGVIRDPTVHRQVLLEVLSFAQELSYGVQGLMRSPLLGPKGNAEFLAWLGYPSTGSADPAVLVEAVLPLD